MIPIKPTTQFEFGKAITMPFRSSDGKQFAWRLWFWMTLWVSLIYIIFMPMFLPHISEYAYLNWETMQAVQNGVEPPDSSLSIQLLRKSMLPLFFLNLTWWFVYASCETALNRKLINGQEYPRIPLRLGLLELKVMAAQFSVAVLFFSSYIMGFILVMIFAGLTMMLPTAIGAFLLVIAFLIYICALIYLLVRLAPASALTVASDDIRVLSARFITKYRFWNLFLAYLVVILGGSIIVNLIYNLLLYLVTGEPTVMLMIMGMTEANPQYALDAIGERLMKPSVMAIGVICLIALSTALSLWYLCLMGVATYAVKWWQADNPEPGFD